MAALGVTVSLLPDVTPGEITGFAVSPVLVHYLDVFFMPEEEGGGGTTTPPTVPTVGQIWPSG